MEYQTFMPIYLWINSQKLFSLHTKQVQTTVFIHKYKQESQEIKITEMHLS
jgi:hypothetical protein